MYTGTFCLALVELLVGIMCGCRAVNWPMPCPEAPYCPDQPTLALTKFVAAVSALMSGSLDAILAFFNDVSWLEIIRSCLAIEMAVMCGLASDWCMNGRSVIQGMLAFFTQWRDRPVGWRHSLMCGLTRVADLVRTT
jgi:hypothetical protein